MKGKVITMKTAVRKMYVNLCGFEFIPDTVSFKNATGRLYFSEPVCCYLMDTEEGYVLFDTGFNRELIHTPELEDKYFTSRGWIPTPVSADCHDLEEQLKDIGVSFDEIKYVIISHLHADHSGSIKKCRNAKVFMQQAEYDYAFGDPAPPWFDVDYDGDEIDWQLIEGDYKLMDGIEIIDTHGHSPGHQSVVVTLPNSGALVLTADAGDFFKNYEEEIPCGENIGDEIALAAIRRLKKEVADRNGTLFPLHDPDWIRQIKLNPEFYD